MFSLDPSSHPKNFSLSLHARLGRASLCSISRTPQAALSCCLVLCFFLCSTFAPGCSTKSKQKANRVSDYDPEFNENTEKVIEEGIPDAKQEALLLEEAMAAYDDGLHSVAKNSFVELEKRFPSGFFAPFAELKAADSDFFRRDFIAALPLYEEYLRLHPQHESAAYVKYQIANCYRGQYRGPKQDQSPLYKAIEGYKTLLRDHPESIYAAQARRRITEARDRTAEHEAFVADFYYRQGLSEASAFRYAQLLKYYPQSGITARAMFQAREHFKDDPLLLAKVFGEERQVIVPQKENPQKENLPGKNSEESSAEESIAEENTAEKNTTEKNTTEENTTEEITTEEKAVEVKVAEKKTPEKNIETKRPSVPVVQRASNVQTELSYARASFDGSSREKDKKLSAPKTEQEQTPNTLTFLRTAYCAEINSFPTAIMQFHQAARVSMMETSEAVTGETGEGGKQVIATVVPNVVPEKLEGELEGELGGELGGETSAQSCAGSTGRVFSCEVGKLSIRVEEMVYTGVQAPGESAKEESTKGSLACASVTINLPSEDNLKLFPLDRPFRVVALIE